MVKYLSFCLSVCLAVCLGVCLAVWLAGQVPPSVRLVHQECRSICVNICASISQCVSLDGAVRWYRQNLADAVRQDEKVDRKIGRNQGQFEALDFNAAVGDSRMTPASAFVATIRGNNLDHSLLPLLFTIA